MDDQLLPNPGHILHQWCNGDVMFVTVESGAEETPSEFVNELHNLIREVLDHSEVQHIVIE